jgi:NAD(P)-dependent dehydrogenase (short-subunit alcohol dehydrogenase family)
MKLQGVSAFVTGGASGLGRATAHALAARGARVLCYDRDAAGAERVAAEVGGVGAGGDVLDSAAIAAAIASAHRASSSTAPASASRSACSAATGRCRSRSSSRSCA